MAQVRLDFYDLDDDALPQLCMKCGAPATTRKEKTFSWCPSWVAVLILVGLLPWFIVALILTKRRRVSVPFCEAHKNHWRWRALFALVGFAVPVLLFVAGIAVSGPRGNDNLSGILLLAGVAGFFVWLIAVAVVYGTAIAPANIDDRSITLKNVGTEFADAYKEQVRGYRTGMNDVVHEKWSDPGRQTGRGAGDQIRRPEPRRPPTDAIEPE